MYRLLPPSPPPQDDGAPSLRPRWNRLVLLVALRLQQYMARRVPRCRGYQVLTTGRLSVKNLIQVDRVAHGLEFLCKVELSPMVIMLVTNPYQSLDV